MHKVTCRLDSAFNFCADLGETVVDPEAEFSALYIRLSNLRSLADECPQVFRVETVQAIKAVLESQKHASQTQSLFLYKQAAETLTAFAVKQEVDRRAADLAFSVLEQIALGFRGNAQRAAAEALATLPLQVRGPILQCRPPDKPPSAGLQQILERAGLEGNARCSLMGRSLVFSAGNGREILVVKTARLDDACEAIHKEGVWMNHLGSGGYVFEVPFYVPVPVAFGDGYLVRLTDAFVSEVDGKTRHLDRYGICFRAHRDYFAYANGREPGRPWNPQRFQETLKNNAWLLGKLASLGIIHTAPIPLFHNRVQRNRRPDAGFYHWPRAGRLDRWLYSCAYPNFGLTGLRDFEHFLSLEGDSRTLYRHIGTHLLSLLLVAGSYFRYQEIEKVGYDQNGNPLDVRYLFDQPLLEEFIKSAFNNYYKGFVGKDWRATDPFDYRRLSYRMVEEMGVDRHMMEILRVADQQEMSDEEFREFLLNRGFSMEEVLRLRKGHEDIAVDTGPHLGGFNERISLPELIEFVSAASAICIADKYLQSVARSENFCRPSIS